MMAQAVSLQRRLLVPAPRILWGMDPERLSRELRFTGLQGIQGIPDETWVQILFAKCPPGPYNLRWFRQGCSNPSKL